MRARNGGGEHVHLFHTRVDGGDNHHHHHHHHLANN